MKYPIALPMRLLGNTWPFSSASHSRSFANASSELAFRSARRSLASSLYCLASRSTA